MKITPENAFELSDRCRREHEHEVDETWSDRRADGRSMIVYHLTCAEGEPIGFIERIEEPI